MKLARQSDPTMRKRRRRQAASLPAAGLVLLGPAPALAQAADPVIVAVEALVLGAGLGGGLAAAVAAYLFKRRQRGWQGELADARAERDAERRRAERADEEAAQAREAENAMFENAMVGLFRSTPEGWLLKANQAVAEIHGYRSFAEMVADGNNYIPAFYVDPSERERLVSVALEQGSVRGFETRLRRRDGSVVWVAIDMRVAYAPDGDVAHFEGALMDISARKQMETKLREAKEQADFASRTKSEFLANTSHELRTPLNAIIGFAEIIKNEMFGAIEPREYVDYARDIHDSGRHLLSLINDILDMSKIEAGRRELEPTRISVDRIVQESLRLIHARADQAGLRIVSEIPEDHPPLWAEERALKQIVVNLLSNAVKFTERDGEVRIAGEWAADGAYRLQVSDTGVGMSESDIQTALVPFGQVDGAFNRQHPGTGLGLPLVRSLVELHGGSLEIASTPGEGSTFTVRLPAERVLAEQAA